MTCMAMCTSGAGTGFTPSCRGVLIPICTQFAVHPIPTAHFRASAVAALGPAMDGRAVQRFVSDFRRSHDTTTSAFELLWFRFKVLRIAPSLTIAICDSKRMTGYFHENARH